MSRPRSESGGPAAAASKRPSIGRRALTLPARPCRIIKDYVAFTNASLRAAVKDYFEDKAATQRRHGKIGTWNVGRVTDMSSLFVSRTDFNEARAGVGAFIDARRGVSNPRRGSPRRASASKDVLDACRSPRPSCVRVVVAIIEFRTSVPGTRSR